jgi:dihydrofolate synthase/folylpolyglutamate synthase
VPVFSSVGPQTLRSRGVEDWLRWQEGLNPKSIDLGLERSAAVARGMGLEGLSVPVVTVAGTNGKGSCVALLAGTLERAGHPVAAYTSPCLSRYNESLRLDGREVDDDTLLDAFERVEEARAGVPLTCFEFRTLAALDIIGRSQVDAALLEVGLGGRLDAVNLLDADVAVITSVGVDHTDWLGHDREGIGAEKAGILRPGRPAVCGDDSPPQSIVQRAEALGTPLHVLGRDFHVIEEDGTWSWQGPGSRREHLPPPAMAGSFQYANAASALMALELLGPALGADDTHARRAIAGVRLAARAQTLQGPVERVIDVAHNPQAARGLAQILAARPRAGHTVAVFAVLGDKDAPAIAAELDGIVDTWHVAGVPGPRGRTAGDLAASLTECLPDATVVRHRDVAHAYRSALTGAQPGDRVVAFGSFLVAREALRLES